MNIDKLKAIKELGITESFYVELLSVFAEEMEPKVFALGEAVKNGDLEGSRKSAHFIKGAAANLRIFEIAESAQEIENLSRDKKPLAEILPFFEKLTASFAEFKKLLPLLNFPQIR